jgi:hypothetical protein
LVVLISPSGELHLGQILSSVAIGVVSAMSSILLVYGSIFKRLNYFFFDVRRKIEIIAPYTVPNTNAEIHWISISTAITRLVPAF